MRRELGIDAGRVAAIVGVMCIHANVAVSNETTDWFGIINQLARFGVPFFFVAMGFFARLEAGPAHAFRTATRLIATFIVWYIGYRVIFGFPDLRHGANPIELMALDEEGHLWFLLSAGLSVLFAAILYRLMGLGSVFVAGVCFYAFGLFLGSYSPSVFGVDLISILNSRNGLTEGVVMIAIGAWLRQGRLNISPAVAALVFAVAALLQLAEAQGLRLAFGMPLTRHDLLISTLLFGPAAFVLFRSLNGQRIVDSVGRIGPLVLGIYLLHPAVMRIFSHVWRPDGFVQFWAYEALIFALSWAAAWAFDSWSVTRSLMSGSWVFPQQPRPKMVPAE